MHQAAPARRAMSSSLKKLAGTLYGGCRPLNQQGELPTPVQGRNFRFFSYGRYAILEALTLSGVGKGEVVLLPEYICRENLSAINALGARVEYYPVGKDLRPSAPLDTLPKAKAVLAINYFGFPQDLSQFETYCHKTGAILIEDNAHGFLSRDKDGAYLGTRGDVGIFSFRKSIPLVNGGGMVVNHSEKTLPLSPQLPFVNNVEPRMFRIKKFLRYLPRWNLTGLLYALIGLDRAVKKFRTGSDYVKSADDAELVLPGKPEPDSNLLNALKSLDLDCEISRRRLLYSEIEKLVGNNGGTPVFPHLPEAVVPYCFPFHSSLESIEEIKRTLKKHYLDCYLWPELPSEIEQKAVEHYKSVWTVNFIW